MYTCLHADLTNNMSIEATAFSSLEQSLHMDIRLPLHGFECDEVENISIGTGMLCRVLSASLTASVLHGYTCAGTKNGFLVESFPAVRSTHPTHGNVKCMSMHRLQWNEADKIGDGASASVFRALLDGQPCALKAPCNEHAGTIQL